MSQLSIVVPSRRSLVQSRFSLETAVICAEKLDAVLIVSDNSGDPAKAEWLQGLGGRVRYLHSSAEDAVANLVNALDHVATPFLMPFADDDAVYVLDGLPVGDLSSLPQDVIGVRPRTMIWRDDAGVADVVTANLDADGPSARIQQYVDTTGGNNALYYSIFRSQLFAGVLKTFNAHHPTRGAYCDWSFVAAFLCCGKVLHDPALIYCYDLGQWNSVATLETSFDTLLLQVGLPATARHYHEFLLFLDLHSLLGWRGLPFAPHDRGDGLQANIRFNLRVFCNRVARQPDLYPQEVKDAVVALGNSTDPETLFATILPVADSLRPGLAGEYRRYRAVLDDV
ncbi:hypothetical protein GOZ96_11115 [Agrobacterium vitis]|uniref:Glycosyltransferase n=1 Tax=Agrobacterium vitis TaxID=373 RepID=A0A368NPP7_AGRVI|nr:hypothetical protein [Agrobacterium vitis]KAA3516816.1 hypothetical protein DXM22_10035 [Agrobacterium vitis]KAA3529581.1 hypothetical protein DXT89_07560 [Agrobacterium vitis]MUZ97149.1 hypothetical protein [Agrobacterium vitis]NOJ36048.1 hypothetical protein [Agrobacterium vitis]RCU52136.1 hypothetical protein ASB66_018395 [Agrobacterium vitis]